MCRLCENKRKCNFDRFFFFELDRLFVKGRRAKIHIKTKKMKSQVIPL